MSEELSVHPIARLFPNMLSLDFEALKEDIRQNGVRLPILVHGGKILDGRHRYKACQMLGLECPTVEWDGLDPWLEVQSRNLVRRHLAKDQIYAIRILASTKFPQIAAPIAAVKDAARQRKAQAKDQPRGRKALRRAQGPNRSADAIGVLLGVSGTTVKRVDRLARLAPEFVPRVATGELSVKKALREAAVKSGPVGRKFKGQASAVASDSFTIDTAIRHIDRVVRQEWAQCPARRRAAFLKGVDQLLRTLTDELESADRPRGVLEATG